MKEYCWRSTRKDNNVVNEQNKFISQSGAHECISVRTREIRPPVAERSIFVQSGETERRREEYNGAQERRRASRRRRQRCRAIVRDSPFRPRLHRRGTFERARALSAHARSARSNAVRPAGEQSSALAELRLLHRRTYLGSFISLQRCRSLSFSLDEACLTFPGARTRQTEGQTERRTALAALR